MSNRDNDFGAFITGFFVGGLIGAVIALLYAPQSGEETRTVIREKSIELKDKAVETAEEALDRAEKSLEEARFRAEKALDDTRAYTEELAQIAKQRAADLQKRGQVVLEEQKARIEEAIEAGKKIAKRGKPETSGSKPGEAAPKA